MRAAWAIKECMGVPPLMVAALRLRSLAARSRAYLLPGDFVVRRAIVRLEIGLGVDPPDKSARQDHPDLHPGLERAQLLQPFRPLQRTGRQRHESHERLASESVHTEMSERAGLRVL